MTRRTIESREDAYNRGFNNGQAHYARTWHWDDQILYFLSGLAIVAVAGLVMLLIGWGAWSFIHWAAQQDVVCYINGQDQSGAMAYHCGHR